MATLLLGGNPVNTIGDLPTIGTNAPNFKLTKTDLTSSTLEDYKGQKVIMSIFPSLETGTCSSALRQFNQEAAELKNTKILCISKDLPFTQEKFCGAEGIENVVMLSDFKNDEFGKAYGVTFTNGGFDGLHSRCVIVVNEEGKITYTEQVQETADEPNYKAALEALMDA